jgi:hypothetical protein
MDLVSKVQMLINEGLFEERPCIIFFVNTGRNTVLIGERPAASIHGLVLGWSGSFIAKLHGMTGKANYTSTDIMRDKANR